MAQSAAAGSPLERGLRRRSVEGGVVPGVLAGRQTPRRRADSHVLGVNGTCARKPTTPGGIGIRLNTPAFAHVSRSPLKDVSHGEGLPTGTLIFVRFTHTSSKSDSPLATPLSGPPSPNLRSTKGKTPEVVLQSRAFPVRQLPRGEVPASRPSRRRRSTALPPDHPPAGESLVNAMALRSRPFRVKYFAVTQKPLPKPVWYKNTYFWISGVLFLIGILGFPFLLGEEGIRDPGQKREGGLVLIYMAGAVVMLVNGVLSHRQTVQHYLESKEGSDS
jgi:hypothetical protein